MSKQVTVEELVANIEEHIADVKRGESVVVTKSGAPVATFAPPPSSGVVFVQRADRSKRLGDYKPKGLGRQLDIDVVALIREDRDKR